MRSLLLTLLLVAGFAAGGTLTSTGVTCVIGTTGDTTCVPSSGPTPPPVCTPPQTGTPPNCVTPPPTPSNCQAQGIAILGGSIISLPWGTAQGGVSNTLGSFGDNIAWVFSLSVPPGQQPTTTVGSIQVAENGGQGTTRNVTMSLTPCDFRAYDGTGVNGPIAVCRNGTTCGVQWVVGAQSTARAGLKAGTTYYLNIRNFDDFGGWSCPTPPGNCPAVENVQPTK